MVFIIIKYNIDLGNTVLDSIILFTNRKHKSCETEVNTYAIKLQN